MVNSVSSLAAKTQKLVKIKSEHTGYFKKKKIIFTGLWKFKWDADTQNKKTISLEPSK